MVCSVSPIPRGIFQFRCKSATTPWRICLILLLQMTVTLGGEEALLSPPVVSISTLPSPVSSSRPQSQPRARVSSLRSEESRLFQHKNDNTTKSFAQQLTLSTPSSALQSWSVLPGHVTQPDEGSVDFNDDNSADEVDKALDGSTPSLTTTPHLNSSVNSSGVPTKRKITRKQFCSKTYAYLDKCLVHIPPIPDIGIPSTPVAVEAACKAFNMGMACVDGWTSKCLAKDKISKFKASISGAHETFTFLCQDRKFRQEFLKHGSCYKMISHQWDECSKHFIDNMKRFHSFENPTIQCCVRLTFLTCVSEISHYYCKKDAAKFLQQMAETLIRSTMRNQVPPQCLSVHRKNCDILSCAPSSFISGESTFSAVIAVSTLLLPLINLV